MKAFVIKDLTILKASLDFAKALGVSVDPDNYQREIGGAISIGTSKRYVVGGNNRPSFYSEKKGLDLIPLNSDFAGDFVDILVNNHYTSTPTSSAEQLELYPDVEKGVDESGYNNDAIFLLVSKVKKLGKDPKNYFVIEENARYGEYLLTTDESAEGVVGNLQYIFNELITA